MRRPWRTLAVTGAALAGLAPSAQAAEDPLAELKAGCEKRESGDAPPVRHRICSGKVPSFDGTTLDVTLTLPARTPRRTKLPLVVMLHGLFGSKAEYLSETRAGDGADRGDAVYKSLRWNNVWFASRGYAVLNYSARAHGESGGELGLAHRDVEIRDTRHITGLLADEALAKRPFVRIARKRVAATGGSYGGGQTWLLMTTREDDSLQYGTWRTPRGQLVRLAAAIPAFTWTDLLYTLAPNGRQLSTGVVDPASANTPFGVGKHTIVNGFVASGGSKLTPELYRWLTRFNAGEPYDDPNDPVVPEAKRGLSVDRSAYYQDGYFEALAAGRQRAVPVLAAQGWTDPIFHAIESLRMYRRLKQVRPRYPIRLYFGDFEHLTTFNKHPDFLRWHALGNRMLDHYLKPRKRKRRRPAPPMDVRTSVSSCERDAFGPVLRAPTWDELAPDRLTFELGGPRQTSSPSGDERGPSTDPVPRSFTSGRGCITTQLGEAPAVASYRVPIDERFTLVGMPRLRLRYRTVAPDIQLNSRLWEVAPDGTQTLISRGAFRAVAPNPAGETAEYEMFGNAWAFTPGRQILLEVVQDDSTYFRRDNFSSTATIEDAQLVLPGRR